MKTICMCLCLVVICIFNVVPADATSQRYVGFEYPCVVINDMVVAIPNTTTRPEVICVDKRNGKLLWRTTWGSKDDHSYGRLIPASNKEIVVASVRDRFSVVDVERGFVVKTVGIRGMVEAAGTNKVVYLREQPKQVLKCFSWEKNKVLWQRAVDPDNWSSGSIKLCGNILLVLLSPTVITSNGSTNTINRPFELVCLRSDDGSVVWRKEMSQPDVLHARCRVVDGDKIAAYSDDRSLYLIEKESGVILRRGEWPVAPDSLVFWGDERLVVCWRNATSKRPMVTIRATKDLSVMAEFQVDEGGGYFSNVYDNMLFWPMSYDRFCVVDLNTHKTRIVTQQTDLPVVSGTMKNGKIIYGWLMEKSETRFLGEYDLLTGRAKVIYSEPVRIAP